MNLDEERVRARARRRRQRNRFVRPVAAGLLGALVLVVGIAIGRALADGPTPGGTRTSVRTLKPQPLPPATKTVTVTVSP
ncbi:MAG: hypothetical protein MSC30_15370 [Gaiellaceae bacterium MAG52_C11]|nr:hypothetical protein [Candidatus Gaiellasilicea maunaloa]